MKARWEQMILVYLNIISKHHTRMKNETVYFRAFHMAYKQKNSYQLLNSNKNVSPKNFSFCL